VGENAHTNHHPLKEESKIEKSIAIKNTLSMLIDKSEFSEEENP